nr:uncharacterized protein LOC113803712 [Penaeus vannamei]
MLISVECYEPRKLDCYDCHRPLNSRPYVFGFTSFRFQSRKRSQRKTRKKPCLEIQTEEVKRSSLRLRRRKPADSSLLLSSPSSSSSVVIEEYSSQSNRSIPSHPLYRSTPQVRSELSTPRPGSSAFYKRKFRGLSHISSDSVRQDIFEPQAKRACRTRKKVVPDNSSESDDSGILGQDEESPTR